jgi:hypothetical protein
MCDDKNTQRDAGVGLDPNVSADSEGAAGFDVTTVGGLRISVIAVFNASASLARAADFIVLALAISTRVRCAWVLIIANRWARRTAWFACA